MEFIKKNKRWLLVQLIKAGAISFVILAATILAKLTIFIGDFFLYLLILAVLFWYISVPVGLVLLFVIGEFPKRYRLDNNFFTRHFLNPLVIAAFTAAICGTVFGAKDFVYKLENDRMTRIEQQKYDEETEKINAFIEKCDGSLSLSESYGGSGLHGTSYSCETLFYDLDSKELLFLLGNSSDSVKWFNLEEAKTVPKGRARCEITLGDTGAELISYNYYMGNEYANTTTALLLKLKDGTEYSCSTLENGRPSRLGISKGEIFDDLQRLMTESDKRIVLSDEVIFASVHKVDVGHPMLFINTNEKALVFVLGESDEEISTFYLNESRYPPNDGEIQCDFHLDPPAVNLYSFWSGEPGEESVTTGFQLIMEDGTKYCCDFTGYDYDGNPRPGKELGLTNDESTVTRAELESKEDQEREELDEANYRAEQIYSATHEKLRDFEKSSGKTFAELVEAGEFEQCFSEEGLDLEGERPLREGDRIFYDTCRETLSEPRGELCVGWYTDVHHLGTIFVQWRSTPESEIIGQFDKPIPYGHKAEWGEFYYYYIGDLY